MDRKHILNRQQIHITVCKNILILSIYIDYQFDGNEHNLWGTGFFV